MGTMKPAAAGGAPYRVPPEPSRWPAIALAAAVHAGLLAFLYIGVSWQNNAPVEVEAEVWDMKTQSAAPPMPVPTPVPTPPEPTPTPPEPTPPEPVPVPKAAPEPKPIPKVAPPPVAKPEPVAPKTPDIALEREKRKAELRKQQALEKEIDEKKQKKLLALEKEKAKEKEKDKEKDKALREKDLKAQQKADALAEKKAKELTEKKLAAEMLKAEKLINAKLAATEQKRLDKTREAMMQRITGGAGVSGDAPKATAPKLDSGYLSAIVSKVKGATSYAGDTEVGGNPRVVFKVDQLPSGEIVSVKKIKGSGVAAFDDSVEKGIIKSSPLPKKKDGTVERTLEIAFSMKDLD